MNIFFSRLFMQVSYCQFFSNTLENYMWWDDDGFGFGE